MLTQSMDESFMYCKCANNMQKYAQIMEEKVRERYTKVRKCNASSYDKALFSKGLFFCVLSINSLETLFTKTLYIPSISRSMEHNRN